MHRCMLPVIFLKSHLLIVRQYQTTFKFLLWNLKHSPPFDSIKIAPEWLAQLQKSTAQDLVLETLKTPDLTGWPEKREQCPIQFCDYWNYREEISLHNGILFKSQRVIVPKAMTPEILSKIHSIHQGIASGQGKAKDMNSWHEFRNKSCS